jgi:TRAP-type mannitol/chloroaromatic compound transport system substrate-binding protein
VRNPVALKNLVEKNGVQIRQAPQDVLIAAGNAAGDIMSELRQDQDPLVKKIADAYVAFRQIAIDNARYTETAMANARDLPYKFAQ